ncbi:MAG: ATP-dependent Clp protease proteolytic subunit, partial [Treponema sp.]|nr:ATP-dependent Clp protease proteolytic subunit [Treponema sp.]
TTEQIEKDMERDFFMSAQDALSYGIVDQVMPARK